MRASALLAAALLVACARPAADGGRGGSSASLQVVAQDSLAGVVEEVGADPATRIVLARPGEPQRALAGDSAQPLRSVLGAEVLVRGRSAAAEFVVSEFVVRAVNGAGVDDGIVGRAQAPGTVELVMRDGSRRPLAPSFETLVGQRVWITRAEPGRAPGFGVIR